MTTYHISSAKFSNVLLDNLTPQLQLIMQALLQAHQIVLLLKRTHWSPDLDRRLAPTKLIERQQEVCRSIALFYGIVAAQQVACAERCEFDLECARGFQAFLLEHLDADELAEFNEDRR